jgi:hypothetical protein
MDCGTPEGVTTAYWSGEAADSRLSLYPVE